MKIRLKRLDETGFDHVLILVVFVVLFAVIGTYFLIQSHAATSTSYQFRMWLSNSTKNSGLCLDDNSSGTSILSYPCNTSDSYQQWTTQAASGGFIIKNVKTGQCVDDKGDSASGSPGNWPPVISWPCNTADHAQVFTWAADGNYGMLKNAYNSGCINDPQSATSEKALIIYPCSGAGKTTFQQSAIYTSGSSGGGSSLGGCTGTVQQELICRAKQWSGAPYLWGGGVHGDGGYTAFKRACERSGSPVKSCGMDCSGFVSAVVDDVTGNNFGWTAGNSVMVGSAAGDSHWHRISASQAVPGDIATASGHVEFVSAVSGGKITQTFGEHNGGDTANAKPAGYFTIGAVYRWE